MARPAISPDRLWTRLMALGEDGTLPGGGVNRQALSGEEILAWRRIIAWGAAAGLEASTDPAGNLFLTLKGVLPHLAPVVAGSHIDSQPTGGLFDGAFGVLAALEAVTAISEAGLTPERSITVVGWMNEEGSRFAPGMMGSELFAGLRTHEEVMAVRDADGVSVGEALGELHAAFPELPRRALGFPFTPTSSRISSRPMFLRRKARLSASSRAARARKPTTSRSRAARHMRAPSR